MPVYVDRTRLTADTPKELWRATDQLKLLEDAMHDYHFDVCTVKRGIAASSGAIELSSREMDRKLDEIHNLGGGNPWKIVR